jgi:hypothetical protein
MKLSTNKKVSMDKVDEEYLVNFVKGKEEKPYIPPVVVVVDYKVGTFTDNNGNERPWANLIVGDVEEYKQLSTIGYEDKVSEIKFKIKNYQGEALKQLKGKKLDTQGENIELQFAKDFRENISGMVFRGSMADLKEVE